MPCAIIQESKLGITVCLAHSQHSWVPPTMPVGHMLMLLNQALCITHCSRFQLVTKTRTCST